MQLFSEQGRYPGAGGILFCFSKNDEGGGLGLFVPVGFGSPVVKTKERSSAPVYMTWCSNSKFRVDGVGVLGILFMKLFTISNPSLFWFMAYLIPV